MKPDHYIPFDWPAFQSATSGWSRQHKWSYLAAICAYYWTDCVGLENDDEFLMSVCECSSGDWAATKARIFREGYFQLEGNRWHQKRAREEYRRAQELIQKRTAQTAKATQLRWRSQSVTDHVTDSVTDSVTDTLTDFVTDKLGSVTDSVTDVTVPVPIEVPVPISVPVPRVGANQSRSASNPEDQPWWNDIISNPAYAGLDSKREFGKMVAWCQPRKKQPTYRRFINWLNRADRSIVPVTGSGELSGADKMIRRDELERILDRLSTIEGQYDSHQNKTPEDVAELKKLRARRDQLRQILGVTL